jgi:parallel beta-helix repeat protein
MNSRQISVRDNVASFNSAFGIYLEKTIASEIIGNKIADTIRWCVISGGEFDGLIIRGCEASGILLDSSGENTISENSILGEQGNGIYLRAPGANCGNGNSILNNKIKGAVWNGIEIGFCKGILIASNEVTDSMNGIWISFMEDAEIEYNKLGNINNIGLALNNMPRSKIAWNSFSDSLVGIFLVSETREQSKYAFLPQPFEAYMSTGNVIFANRFSNLKKAGIHIVNASENQVLENEFEGTEVHYLLEGNSNKNNIRENTLLRRNRFDRINLVPE